MILLFVLAVSNIDECPKAVATGPLNGPRTVRVEVLSIKPNTDMEDDIIPFIDDRADIFGKVQIENASFELPEKEETDEPTWHGTTGTFEAKAETQVVHVRIEAWDRDTAFDDPLDLSPGPADALELRFNLCSLLVSGDASGSAQSIITVNSGTDANDAVIKLRFSIVDAGPMTVDDIALLEADIVQVVRGEKRIVTGKPAVVMVRAANMTTRELKMFVDVTVDAPGSSTSTTVELGNVGSGGVGVGWTSVAQPFTVPHSAAGQQIYLNARVRAEDYYSKFGPYDCESHNDSLNKLPYTAVRTKNPDVLWVKAGITADQVVTGFASDAQLERYERMSKPFIEGTYPIQSLQSTLSYPPLDLRFTPEQITAFGGFGPSVGLGYGCWMVVALGNEVAAYASLLGRDQVFALMPKGFLQSSFPGCFDGDMGKNYGRASLMMQHPADQLLLIGSAHEFGHGLGLSVAAPADYYPEEYDRDGSGDGSYKAEPASGYWIANTSAAPELQMSANKPQCDKRCFMGTGAMEDYKHWDTHGSWIDRRDYSHLFDRLTTQGSGGYNSATLIVTGVLGGGAAVITSAYTQEGRPDETGNSQTHAGLRFRSASNRVLGDYPIRGTIIGDKGLETFSMRVPFDVQAASFEIFDRKTDATLASRKLSATAPAVKTFGTSKMQYRLGEIIRLSWSTGDAERDAVRVMPIARSNTKRGFIPLSAFLDERETSLLIPASTLGVGNYQWEVIAHDGVRTTTSADGRVFKIVP